MYIQVQIVDNNIVTMDGKFIGTKGNYWTFFNRFEVLIVGIGERTILHGYIDLNGQFHEFCSQQFCRFNLCATFGKEDCKHNKIAQSTSGYYMLID